nr:PAS domain S-box protein [uncultured Methanospirillum sp.]
MDLKNKPVILILDYLSKQCEGKSVFEISTSLGMNRNLVSKYLSILLMQGRVELKPHGTMKVYRLSNRIPFSFLSRINETFLIGLDQFYIIKECIGDLPPFFYQHNKIIGKKIQTMDYPGFQEKHVLETINQTFDGKSSFNHHIQIGSYWHLIKIIPIIFDDRTIGIALSFSDITQMKGLESAETFWKSRYMAITDMNPDMVLHLSPDGKITSVNPAFTIFQNVAKKDIIGTTIIPGLMTEDQKKISDLIYSLSFNNPHTEIILQTILKNGSIHWIKWKIIGIFLDQNLMEVLLQGSDITRETLLEFKYTRSDLEFQSLIDEKNKAIIELNQNLKREREEKKILEYKNQMKVIENNSLLQSTHNVILKITNLGVIQNINIGFTNILDYPSDKIIGKNIAEFLYSADALLLKEKLHLVNTKFEPIHHVELMFRSNTGSPIYVDLSGVPILSDNKKELTINCIGQVITKRRIMEQELKKLKTIMDKTSDIINIFNEKGYFQYINQAGKRILEIPESNSINTYKLTQFIRKSSQKEFDFGLKIATDRGIWRGEITLTSLSGRDRPISIEIITYRDSPDASLIYLTVGRDISERMIHYQELSRINAYNRGLLETSNDALLLIGSDGIIKDVNKSTEIFTGYQYDELVGSKFSRYCISLDELKKGCQQVLTEGIIRNYQIDIEHRSRKIIKAELNASIFRDENRITQGIIASIRDIASQCKKNDELIQQYEYYLVVLDNFSYPVLRFGFDGKLNSINKSYFEFSRGTHDAKIFPDLTEEIHPKDFDRLFLLHTNSYKNHQPFNIKHRHRYKNGSYRWVKYFSKPLYSISGEFIGNIGTFIDMHAGKEEYEHIQEKDLRLLKLISKMPIGVVLPDIWGECILINQEWTNKRDISFKDSIGIGWVQKLHYEDRDILLNKWKTTIESDEEWGFNFQFKMNDGKTVLVYGKAYLLSGPEGTTTRYIGFNAEISPENGNKSFQLESGKKLKQKSKDREEGTWTIDSEGYTMFVNQRMADILGYSPEEMKGRHLFSFMDDKGVQYATNLISRRKDGISEEHVFIFIHKSGKEIFTKLSTSPIIDSSGNYLGAIAIVIDLSNEKNFHIS